MIVRCWVLIVTGGNAIGLGGEKTLWVLPLPTGAFPLVGDLVRFGNDLGLYVQRRYWDTDGSLNCEFEIWVDPVLPDDKNVVWPTHVMGWWTETEGRNPDPYEWGFLTHAEYKRAKEWSPLGEG